MDGFLNLACELGKVKLTNLQISQLFLATDNTAVLIQQGSDEPGFASLLGNDNKPLHFCCWSTSAVYILNTIIYFRLD